ncbi:MAG TPA: AAA family ATPase [Candidatus Dormibacteraeota bacterium]|jgi:ATP-dependent Zn protease|nr:AAA family ATPase [Candidatus Dormibacteraeota bacterium]
MLLWLMAILVAISSGFFAWVFGVGPIGALIWAVATLLVFMGLMTVMRRWLVMHDHLVDRTDLELRTIETNRAIFWRRTFFLAIVLVLYLGVTVYFLGMQTGTALILIPYLLYRGISVVGYFLIFMIANFSILFLPFVAFGRMGRETIEPGDANYDVKISDVRGQKSAIVEMERILRLMEQGRNYVRAGGKRERGVLFVGPPGTGKTMLAKGIASSLSMPIIISSGASFQGMFMGMDMLNVYMMVRAAKKKAKRWGGCAIFIDEFDALGSRRSGMGGGPGGMGGMMGGMMGGFQLGLNMLLVQMDGVDNPGMIKKALRRFVNVCLDGIFIPRSIGKMSLRLPQLRPPRYNLFFMGATNRPSVLDEAVTRPGRFGRTITFRMPTREDRKDIAELYFDKKAHDPELDSTARRDEFARITEGYSPAMIEQALSLALMYAFEEGRSAFNWKDLRDSMGNIEAGLAEPVVYSERDQIAVARHELGHAIASRYFLPDQKSARLSIRMRGDSLGHHRAISEEEQLLLFRSQLAGELRHALGAIASERVFYGENSSGVAGDLRSATRLACQMVGVFGMGQEDLDTHASQRAANIGESLISRAEAMQGLADGGGNIISSLIQGPSRRVVAQIMGSAFVDCWRVMYVNREAIDRAAQALIAHGELMGDEITSLLDWAGLREPTPNDPYPEELAQVPPLEVEQPFKVSA